MATNKLRPDTAWVWAALEGHPLLRGFILIGGTALTLRIGHRVSEDLDFAYTAPKLPKAQVSALVKHLAALNVQLVPEQNPLDEEEFFDSGLDLSDYQQNFLASHDGQGSVKISLVCFDPPMTDFLRGLPADPVRVATLGEIFETKAWLCSERSKTRDWIDLFTLIKQHGYTFDDVYAVFRRVGRLAAFNNATSRLRSCKPGAADEGYLPHPARVPNGAPTLDEMREFFNRELDALQTRLARAAFRSQALDSQDGAAD